MLLYLFVYRVLRKNLPRLDRGFWHFLYLLYLDQVNKFVCYLLESHSWLLELTFGTDLFIVSMRC